MHSTTLFLAQQFPSLRVAACLVVLSGAVALFHASHRRPLPPRPISTALSVRREARLTLSGAGRSLFGRRATAGFTLPELIGSIIVIGVIAAVSAVQVLNANAQAREFAKYSTAQSLNRISVSAIVGGANVGAGATNNIDTTTNLTAIAKLNAGFTVGGITYAASPTVKTPASYPFNGSPTATSVVFTYTTGAAALP